MIEKLVRLSVGLVGGGRTLATHAERPRLFSIRYVSRLLSVERECMQSEVSVGAFLFSPLPIHSRLGRETSQT